MKKELKFTIFDERPKNNFLTKAIIRINKNFIKKIITNYYKRIISEIKNKSIDYLMVIRGEVIPKWFLVKLKKLTLI